MPEGVAEGAALDVVSLGCATLEGDREPGPLELATAGVDDAI